MIVQHMPRPRPNWHAEAKSLYADGWSIPAIARKFSCGISSVTYAIEDERGRVPPVKISVQPLAFLLSGEGSRSL